MGRGVSKSSCQKSRHLDGDWLVVFEWQSPKNDNVASGPDGVPVARDSESFMHLGCFLAKPSCLAVLGEGSMERKAAEADK